MLECRHWVRGATEGLSGLARGGLTPWHSHDHTILGIVDSGRQSIDLRTSTVAIGPGMGFVIPPGLAHRCAYARGTRYRILCVYTERRLAFCVFASPGWPAAFDRTFDALCREATVDADRLAEEAAQLIGGRPASPLVSPPAYVEESFAEVNSDLDGNKRLAELARRQGLSSYHLQRTFARFVGLTPCQTRLCARVRASKRQLADGMRPTEVAYLCGFADQSHMTRTFERFMGVAPKRYQRQIVIRGDTSTRSPRGNSKSVTPVGVDALAE
jgi:AraC-like DNA-binding protein